MTQQPRRKRGVILTPQGKQKLLGAIREFEQDQNFGEKYTIEELSSQTGLDPGTVTKVLNAEERADRRTIDRFFQTFNLELAEADYRKPPSAQNLDLQEEPIATRQNLKSKIQNRVDWGEAVDVSIFYGRAEELTTLKQWIVTDRCRLVALLGMGGIGKTSLAAKLGEEIQGEFEVVVWRSLRNAPMVEELLAGVIQFLSNQQEFNLPNSLDGLINSLIQYLSQHRCLLILDNAESILRGRERAGQYRDGFAGYGDLIRRVGEASHQSCLILTSREKPKEVSLLEGRTRPVHSLQLSGLSQTDGQRILQAEGNPGTEDEQQELLRRYTGNPLAVKIAATTIQELFAGDISSFLGQGATVFGDIRDLLDQQFERLTELGKTTMYWLAINREPVSLAELREDFFPPVTPQKLLEALESLERRSLIEKSTTGFTLQNVVMEYVTDRLIEKINEELCTGSLDLFNTHALIKATAKDYVRQTQTRLILQPIVNYLNDLEKQFLVLLQIVRSLPKLLSGYSSGNILNILCFLNIEIRNYDFSCLTIRQGYLKGSKLYHGNFENANFISPVLTHTFGNIFSIVFSPNGKLLATGDSNGEIQVWSVADGQPLVTCQGHNNWVRTIAFSPDGQMLASGSDDQTIRLWDLKSSQCLHIFQIHSHRVWSVAFSPDGQMLASGSNDQTVQLWDLRSYQCLHSLLGHSGWVRSVAFSPDGQMLISSSDDHTIRLWNLRIHQCCHIFQGHSQRVLSAIFSPDGQMLASGSDDQTIRLWDVKSQQCLYILQEHSRRVRSVAFSPDGQMLASGSDDQTVRLWDLGNHQCLHIFQGHSHRVQSVVFSPDGQMLASGSDDQTVRLWDLRNHQCLHIFQGHSHRVQSVVFSPDGQMLASGGGSDDQTIRLWDVESQKCFGYFKGHTSWLQSVVFSPDGQMLASGSDDQTIRLWDVKSQQCLHVFQGHSSWVRSVAFSPDGQTIASGSDDQTIRFWDVKSQQCLHVFQGHSSWVRSVAFSPAFSPDGQILASGSEDQTIRLWNFNSQQCLHILRGHSSWVRSVAFSPDGQMLASGSEDQTVRLWSLKKPQCLYVFHGHNNWVWSVAFSPDGKLLASGSEDKTVRLWDVESRQCLCIFQGHTHRVWSIAFSPDGRVLASGSGDGTIRLWNISENECVAILRVPRPYEKMNITGATGLTEAQKASLIALGAIDDA